MGASDFKVNAKVRSVLARHWVDLAAVGFSSIHGTVRLTGKLCRLSSDSDADPFTKQKVAQLETELMSIREVRRIYFDLDNWRKDKERQWVLVKALNVSRNGKEEKKWK